MEYLISSTSSPFGEPAESATAGTPEEAFTEWCRQSERHPTCASIQPRTEDDGMALLKWAALNMDRAEACMAEHRCPYRTEWVREQVMSAVRKGKTSMQWEYDELFPFCMG